MASSASSASAQRGSQVICTCKAFGCALQSFINEFGIQQPGCLVAPSTRTVHRRKDRHPQQAAENLPCTTEGESVISSREYVQDDSTIMSDEQGLESHRKSLYDLICILAAWLHLVCGLSATATTQVLKYLEMVVLLAINLGCLMAQVAKSRVGSTTLPCDVRTAMNALSIEPSIIHSVCCPKCFAKYSLDSMPNNCSWRESPRSKPCNEPLWTTRSTRKGPCHVPQRLYSTQNLESWLEFFLSRPGIEELIQRSYAHHANPDAMHIIWDSPAWKSLGPFTTTPGNLTFSYFIDWFNPLTNKIAGKSVSCGAVMLFCLNLPYELQHLPENTFFAGIIPGPKEPNVITITAVSDPIVEQLNTMWHGKNIQTYCHPGGTPVHVAILPAIGDLLAMRKALGFAGISSHHFCSFCELLLENIDDLESSSWKLRTGPTVKAAAMQWLQARTKTERKALFAKHGVRWSSLHQLQYRDPVWHTVLGVMHNWLEGILQHHTRRCWGIGVPESIKKVELDMVKSRKDIIWLTSDEADVDFIRKHQFVLIFVFIESWQS